MSETNQSTQSISLKLFDVLTLSPWKTFHLDRVTEETLMTIQRFRLRTFLASRKYKAANSVEKAQMVSRKLRRLRSEQRRDTREYDTFLRREKLA